MSEKSTKTLGRSSVGICLPFRKRYLWHWSESQRQILEDAGLGLHVGLHHLNQQCDVLTAFVSAGMGLLVVDDAVVKVL